MNNMALVYVAQGEYSEAGQLCERTLGIRRRVSGERHLSTIIVMNNLADLYRYEGKCAQAEELFSEALEAGRNSLGQDHEVTLIRGAWATRMPVRAGTLRRRRSIRRCWRRSGALWA